MWLYLNCFSLEHVAFLQYLRMGPRFLDNYQYQGENRTKDPEQKTRGLLVLEV